MADRSADERIGNLELQVSQLTDIVFELLATLQEIVDQQLMAATQHTHVDADLESQNGDRSPESSRSSVHRGTRNTPRLDVWRVSPAHPSGSSSSVHPAIVPST